jgi:hypothetical protein
MTGSDPGGVRAREGNAEDPRPSPPPQSSATTVERPPATPAGQPAGTTGDDMPRHGRLYDFVVDRGFPLLSAILTVIAAALGVWGTRATSQRDALAETTSSLERQVAVLEDDNTALEAEVVTITESRDEWRARAEAPSSTTSTTDGTLPPTTIPPPPGIFLAELEPVTDRTWDISRDLNIDGTIYAQGMDSGRLGYCGSNGPGTTQEVEYSVGQEYETLHTVVGLSEESAPNLPVKVEIVGDGQPLWSATLVVGEPQTIDVDVAGVLRLRVVATKQFENPGGCSYVYAALGDPTLR